MTRVAASNKIDDYYCIRLLHVDRPSTVFDAFVKYLGCYLGYNKMTSSINISLRLVEKKITIILIWDRIDPRIKIYITQCWADV